MRRLAYGGQALDVAKSLLGQRLVRCMKGQHLVGRIVEVEAYVGTRDLASHTAGGRRTARNESMYLGGGHVYVYLIYGMHHCFNVTSGRRGSGAAVLVRAIEPLEGVEAMQARRTACRSRRDLCRGPGRLCQALDIDRGLDGEDLRTSDRIWIERGDRIPVSQIVAGPRVGIGNAGEWRYTPLRLALTGSSHVSTPVPTETVQDVFERHEIDM